MEEQIYEYIEKHTTPQPESLRLLERKANIRLIRSRMLSGHLQGRLLKMICAMLKPRNVLELGTFTGYSALCLAEGLSTEGSLVYTIECDDEIYSFIQESLANSPYGHLVKVFLGDAVEISSKLIKEIPFDLVYIDANKRDYILYYDTIIQDLPTGAVILADNTLWSSKVLTTPKESDVQTKSIIEFNHYIQQDPRVENIILPLRDGLSIIRKL